MYARVHRGVLRRKILSELGFEYCYERFRGAIFPELSNTNTPETCPPIMGCQLSLSCPTGLQVSQYIRLVDR